MYYIGISFKIRTVVARYENMEYNVKDEEPKITLAPSDKPSNNHPVPQLQFSLEKEAPFLKIYLQICEDEEET